MCNTAQRSLVRVCIFGFVHNTHIRNILFI